MLLYLITYVVLAVIIYQDITSRAVYWFLFPLLALVLGGLFLKYYPEPSAILHAILLNGILVSIILITLFLYTKLIAGQKFLNHSFGMGDLLLFYALCVGFPTVTFVFLLATCLAFSLITFTALKSKLKDKSVPLAGLMGFCLFCILMASSFLPFPILYAL